MGIYTKEEQFELIKENPLNLEKIENQYEDVCLAAVRENGFVLKYVKEQTKEICLEAVKRNGRAFEYVKEQTEKICLEAVKKDGNTLQYVKEQTEEICLEAVKNNGYALQYVKEQTEVICMKAIEEERRALKYVKELTPRTCFYLFLIKYNDFLNNYKIIYGVNELIKSKYKIENKIFCINKYLNILKNKGYVYFDINSLIYLKCFLLKENENNTYVFDDEYFSSEDNLELLKEIALSNNELVIVDTGNIKDVHRILANRIIKEKDLEKESF